jgi:hypothetical protein
MKHILSFNESISQIGQNIKDICLEITDMGFRIYILKEKDNYILEIFQGDRSNWWSIDNKIKDNEQWVYSLVIDHLESHMKELGYTMKVIYNLTAANHHITYNFLKN